MIMAERMAAPIVVRTRLQTCSVNFITRSRMTARQPVALHDAAVGEGGEGDELGLHHAHHAALGQERVDEPRRPVRAGSPEFIAVATTVNGIFWTRTARSAATSGRQDHGRDGRLLGDGEIEDDGHGQEQEQVEAEVGLERGQDEVQGLRPGGRRVVSQAGEEIDGQPGQPGGPGRPDHVLDVVEQVRSGDDRGQVGDVGERRHLVAEIGPGDDRPGGRAEGDAEAHGDADEGDADRPDRPPRRPAGDGHDRARRGRP